MKTYRFFPFYLSLVLLLPLLACGEESSSDTTQEGKDTTAQSDSGNPTGKPFSDAEWIEKGVPNPDHIWRAAEMDSAAKVITTEYGHSSTTLPRYDSTRSDGIFARINSLENFAYFEKDSIPILQRLTTGMEMIQAYVPIYTLYANETMGGKPYNQELTEMMIALVTIEEKFASVISKFIETVPAERKESEQFMSGMKQMRAGIVQSANGMITVLRDKQMFTTAQLEKIGASAKEILPRLLTFLDEDSRQAIRAEAKNTIDATDNPIIKEDLQVVLSEGSK